MNGPRGSWSVGIDVGGTFTDLVAVDSETGAAHAAKVLSTPNDQSEGVTAALREPAGQRGAIARIVHGTTVVTNMLLERSGARVVLCATQGATDLLELRRQERAALFDLSKHHPPALVATDDVVAVHERVEPQGITLPLTAQEIERVVAHVKQRNPDVVAISLLHSYADASHELALARALAHAMPHVDVVCSCEVLPEVREYERTATTSCEAYARPGVGRYLSNLGQRVAALGMPVPGVMTSGGGMRDALDAAHHAASLALSGPAGGVAGAALVAKAAGFEKALSVDIGGTSADVGLIWDGGPLVEAGGLVAGVPIALPRVLVDTVSAGGGSIGWRDAGGVLRVGPRSAGAVPGPAAFGRGGTLATVTDAHVTLGNIRSDRMGQQVHIDGAAARHAVGALARELGESEERTASAMIDIADAEMARALRRVSVERGIDPRECVLVAFGGGGPLHACGLAERLGMTRILVPPFAGVLSALGLAVAPEQRVAMASVMRLLDATLQAPLRQAADRTSVQAGGAGRAQWIVRARFVGQGYELEVPYRPNDDLEALRQEFLVAHQRRYGFVLALGIEVVSLRCTKTGVAPTLSLARVGVNEWGSAQHDTGGALDLTLHGRTVVALPDATMLVASGWSARSLPIGGWLLERSA